MTLQKAIDNIKERNEGCFNFEIILGKQLVARQKQQDTDLMYERLNIKTPYLKSNGISIHPNLLVNSLQYKKVGEGYEGQTKIKTEGGKFLVWAKIY